MSDQRFSRRGDIVAGDHSKQPIDPTPFLGRWRNSNPNTQGITGFTIALRGEAVVIHAVGLDAPFDWGEEVIHPHAYTADGAAMAAFLVRYDFGFMESTLAGNINGGLIVIAAYNRFTDGSGRSDYFSREYYYNEA